MLKERSLWVPSPKVVGIEAVSALNLSCYILMILKPGSPAKGWMHWHSKAERIVSTDNDYILIFNCLLLRFPEA